MNNGKAGFGLPGLAALLFLLFALPWVGLSCAGQELITQNGYQAVVGAGSVNDALQGSDKKEFDEKAQKGGSLGAAWWLGIVLLAGGAAGFAGFKVARGNAGMARVAVVTSGAAALILSGSLVIGLPLERKIDEMKKEMAAESKKDETPMKGLGDLMGASIVGKRYNGLWLALTTTWAMVGLSLFLTQASKGSPPPAPPPPPAA